MKMLTAENVEAVFLDCLFRDGEDTAQAKIVDGIVSKFGFHPERQGWLERMDVKPPNESSSATAATKRPD